MGLSAAVPMQGDLPDPESPVMANRKHRGYLVLFFSTKTRPLTASPAAAREQTLIMSGSNLGDRCSTCRSMFSFHMSGNTSGKGVGAALLSGMEYRRMFSFAMSSRSAFRHFPSGFSPSSRQLFSCLLYSVVCCSKCCLAAVVSTGNPSRHDRSYRLMDGCPFFEYFCIRVSENMWHIGLS